MYRVFQAFLIMAVFAVVIQAQLTFSTDWGNGKRSIRSQLDDRCATEESVLAIYNLIQVLTFFIQLGPIFQWPDKFGYVS